MNRLSKTWQSLKSYPNRSVEVQSFFSLKSFGHHISTDMEKSHPNRNQTIPNWIEINQPNSTHKKATNHTPKLKPHFHPFSTTSFFVRSTRWSPWMNHSSRRRPRRFALRTLPLGRNVGTAVEGGSFLVGEVTEQLVGWLICLICCFFVLFC